MTVAPQPSNGVYMLNGEPYARVTTVLGIIAKPGLEAWRHRLGLKEAERVSQAAASLGTRVHAVCEAINREDDLAATEDTALLPFARAYVEWFMEHVKTVLGAERFVKHDAHGYAGTVDLFAEMRDGRRMVVDLKTSNSLDGTFRLQTEAYAEALRFEGEHVDGRMVVNLPSKRPGELHVVEFDDGERDRKAWRACLRLYRWNERHQDDWRNGR